MKFFFPCPLLVSQVALWIAGWAASAPAADNNALLDQNLAGADLATQTPPLGSPPYSSVTWHVSDPKNAWADTEGLCLGSEKSGNLAVAWAFFAPADSPIVLEDGQSLQLTFDYSYTENSGGTANAFRFGLFHSGENGHDLPPGSAFCPPSLRGYTVHTNPQSGREDGAAIYAEDNGGSQSSAFTSAGGGRYKQQGEGFASVDAMVRRLTARMTITRKQGIMSVAVDFDTSSPDDETVREGLLLDLNEFDTLAFAHQCVGTPSRAIRIHRVLLERVPAKQP